MRAKRRVPFCVEPADEAVAAALRGHVEVLAGLIGVRHDSRPSTLAAARAHIERHLAAAGGVVERQGYATDAGEAVNLVVEKAGTRRPGEVVVLGAHYDTVKGTPGADDNASAVAALLEAAGVLLQEEHARTLRLVAFANEEPPHFGTATMGSDVYAKACRARGDDVRVMVCLEMLGYYDDAPGSQAVPGELPGVLKRVVPERGDFIAAVCDPSVASVRRLRRFRRGFRKAVRFPLIAAPVPKRLMWVSDHGPFWDVGYPAMMLTDTAWFRNPHYHEASDLPATLDYARFARVTRGMIGGVQALLG